jgi:hypothetical protein
MTCGLPVIACQVHGPAAIVAGGGTGWLIRPDDEDALSSTHSSPPLGARRNAGRVGRRAQTDSSRYGWAEIARRFASLHAELIASFPGSRLRGGGALDRGRLTPFRSTSRSPISQRLPRISNATGTLLALPPKPLVVPSFDGVVERPQLVAAAIRDVQNVINGLGPVSAQDDRVVGVLDQPELDRVGDWSSSFGSFGARLVRRLHPQVLRHERCRSLVERIPLTGDLEYDVHSAEPSSALVGVL